MTKKTIVQMAASALIFIVFNVIVITLALDIALNSPDLDSSKWFSVSVLLMISLMVCGVCWPWWPRKASEKLPLTR